MSLSNQTDRELLEAIRNGDEHAFAELFRRYFEKAHSITMARVRSEEVTKEIVQELFISLWEKRASLNINHFPSYLYTAIKNRSLNYIASQNVLKKNWDHYKTFVPTAANVTEDEIQLVDLNEQLEYSVDQLPEKSKMIFKLNRLDGRSVSEIASAFNLSEKAIQYHITLSLKKLRLQLKDFVLTLLLFLNFVV